MVDGDKELINEVLKGKVEQFNIIINNTNLQYFILYTT